MPTFRTERMNFLHLPKTGGMWVWHAVAAAGVRCEVPEPLNDQIRRNHNHDSLLEVDLGERFSVTFVRHPLDWWRSYWGYRMRAGWHAEHAIDRVAASEDFNVFATRVAEHFPGHLSDLVRHFVGSPAPAVDFVGRFEHLVDDTCAALRLAGEPFDEIALRGCPNVNVTDYNRFPALYRPDVAERLADAESQTIERFYVDDPIPEALIARCAEGLAGRPHREIPPAATYARLDASGLQDHVRALERALERAHDSEASLELALAHVRAQQEQAERALSSLRASRVVRYTRPLRLAYYRARAYRGRVGEALLD